jgi:two-component system, chemotaxis family, chemotaxis protein CheY
MTSDGRPWLFLQSLATGQRPWRVLRHALMFSAVTTDMDEKVSCEREAGARAPQKERTMDSTHRVLIVDDAAVNRRLAQVLFQKLGWEVEAVDSGEQALLSLAAHCPDLVLLDISMPGMTGLEVCQRIRADHTLAGLRVIAYTAHAFLEQQQRFLAGGFDDVLVKPISLRAVQELLWVQTLCPCGVGDHLHDATHPRAPAHLRMATGR